MNERSRFGYGIAWSYIQSWGARGITSFSFFIVGFYINPHEFGLFALVSAILVFCELVCEQSLSQSIVQWPSEDNRLLNNVFFTSLLLGALIAAFLFISSSWLADYFSILSLKRLLREASICPLIIALSAVPTGLIRRDMKFKLLAQRTVLASLVSSVLGIVLVAAGFGAEGLVAQVLCYYIVGSIVIWRKCDWRPRWSFLPRKYSYEILHLSTSNLSNKVLDFFEIKGLELVVGMAGGVEALGYFAFANKIGQTLFQLLASPVIEVVFASVAGRQTKSDVSATINSGQLIIATLPSIMLFGLICSAKDFLHIVYADRWIGAGFTLSLLCFGLLLRANLYIFGSSLLALRASRSALLSVFVRTTVTLAGAYFALKNGEGSEGVAISYVVGGVFALPISLILVSRVTNIPMKQLITIPLKLTLAMMLSAGAYLSLESMLGQHTSDPWVSVGAALIASLFMVLMVLILFSGLLAQKLSLIPVESRLTSIVYPALLTTRRIISARDDIGLKWFSLTLQVSMLFHRGRSAEANKTLIVPADVSDVDGSLGDQLLLSGLASLVNADRCILVVSKDTSTQQSILDFPVFPVWGGLWSGWLLGKKASEIEAVYVIGADVMDGYYSKKVSCERLILASAFNSVGIRCTVTGFSFNEAPHPGVVTEFRCLPQQVRLCLRDASSLERFERIVERKAELVADLGFLAKEEQFSEVSLFVSSWADEQRAAGRRVVGININPQVTAHIDGLAWQRLASSISKSCARLLAENVSIVLIPHDFRAGCADFRVLKAIADEIDYLLRDRVLLIETRFFAKDIKAALRSMDLVLSARMHLAISALSVGTPVCCIQYQGKFEGLFSHFFLGSDEFISPESALESSSIFEFLSRNLENSEYLRQKINSRLSAVRKLSFFNCVSAV